MEKTDDSSDNEIYKVRQVKSDGRNKERTEEKKTVFLLISQRRKTLNETKEVVTKPKKKVIEKPKGKRATSKTQGQTCCEHLLYYYGMQPHQVQDNRRTLQEAPPVPVPPVAPLPPPPLKPELKNLKLCLFKIIFICKCIILRKIIISKYLRLK